MAERDGFSNVEEFAPRLAGMAPEHLERLVIADPVALHQDALSTLGDCSTLERPLEPVVLGETPEHDVDRALHLTELFASDVGEDASLRGFLDELAILHVEDGDHRAGSLVYQKVDRRKSGGRPVSHDHQRHVWSLELGEASHLGQRRLPGDDLMAQVGNCATDRLQASSIAHKYAES